MHGVSSVKRAKKIKSVSSETITMLAMLESLPGAKRKYLTEKLRELINEEISDQKWDTIIDTNSQPMLKMAAQALKEHRQGKSKSMNL
jgi:hypothetical protein